MPVHTTSSSHAHSNILFLMPYLLLIASVPVSGVSDYKDCKGEFELIRGNPCTAEAVIFHLPERPLSDARNFAKCLLQLQECERDFKIKWWIRYSENLANPEGSKNKIFFDPKKDPAVELYVSSSAVKNSHALEELHTVPANPKFFEGKSNVSAVDCARVLSESDHAQIGKTIERRTLTESGRNFYLLHGSASRDACKHLGGRYPNAHAHFWQRPNKHYPSSAEQRPFNQNPGYRGR